MATIGHQFGLINFLMQMVTKMQTLKHSTKQAQANYDSSPWLYSQEVKQTRKASKELRSVRKGKKNFWQATE